MPTASSAASSANGFSALRKVLRRWPKAAATSCANSAASESAGRAAPSGVSRATADSTLGGGRNAPAGTTNSRSTAEANLQHHRQPPVLGRRRRRRHALDDLLLQHDGDVAQIGIELREMKQQRRRDVVRQVADDAQVAAERWRSRTRAHRPRAARAAPAGTRRRARAARSRSISMTVRRSTLSSSGRVSAPRPGPISTRRSPRFGAIASTMRST